jgi:hypothetical protein
LSNLLASAARLIKADLFGQTLQFRPGLLPGGAISRYRIFCPICCGADMTEPPGPTRLFSPPI